MLDLDPIRDRLDKAYGSAATPIEVIRDVISLITEVERITMVHGEYVQRSARAIAELGAEIDALEATIDRVRELHTPSPYGKHPYCVACGGIHDMGETWPCPTIRALEGDTDAE